MMKGKTSRISYTSYLYGREFKQRILGYWEGYLYNILLIPKSFVCGMRRPIAYVRANYMERNI